jgi:hypothetical protein
VAGWVEGRIIWLWVNGNPNHVQAKIRVPFFYFSRKVDSRQNIQRALVLLIEVMTPAYLANHVQEITVILDNAGP